MNHFIRTNKLENQREDIMKRVVINMKILNHYNIILDILQYRINQFPGSNSHSSNIINSFEYFDNLRSELLHYTSRLYRRAYQIKNMIEMSYLN